MAEFLGLTQFPDAPARGIEFNRTRPRLPQVRQVALPVIAPNFQATLSKFLGTDARLAEELMMQNRSYHTGNGK
jgi:hypothetical protein